MSRNLFWGIILVIFLVLVFLLIKSFNEFPLPEGEPTTISEPVEHTPLTDEAGEQYQTQSGREVFETDGVRHSIPIDEILSGGPGKDGIPSIDNPKFIETKDADDWLGGGSVGLGLERGDVARFYPYSILVWHEIVNDTIAGEPVVVTYCPLCATGVVYDRIVRGETLEFGVSGRLWQSNLLMYDRTANEEDESLWSQVLGEAVVGEKTGEKLQIVRSDTITYEDWKKLHPDTKVLSKDTGATRVYGYDPYEERGYYENLDVGFGASFNDDRSHPKSFVVGVEVDGKYKAYDTDALQIGETTDLFAGETITINKSEQGEIKMYIGSAKTELPYIGGFWFSWLAVHPDTELYN